MSQRSFAPTSWLLGAMLLVAACKEQPKSQPEGATAAEQWLPVRAADDAPALEVPARVLAGPGATTVVTPPLRATVLRIRARPGDVVDAGAPLVDVVMPEALDAAGRFEGARVRLQAWTERHEQLAQLRADGLAKSLDVSEAAARVAESKADLQAARAVLLSAGVREGEAASLLGGSGALSLRAPVSGVVTALSASIGESREPSAGPLVQLASAGPVRVEARFAQVVPDGQYDFVGTTGRVPLTLVSRAPIADARDGTYLAWFEPGGELPAGTLGRVVVRGGGAVAVFRVAAHTIARVDGVATVATKHGPVPVDVVRCEQLDCLVRGALTTSDEVKPR
ncbi:MAG: efflux RND transporter periplasmic adaptor subunit [Myxococcota bacterium]